VNIASSSVEHIADPLLQKANLGNAKTDGLEKDLGMAGTNDYNILLSIFFVPYVLAAPFVGMLGKIYGPSRVLPIMMFSFGSMTLLTVAAYNFGGLVTLRVFLGTHVLPAYPKP
jgi:MFS family permease